MASIEVRGQDLVVHMRGWDKLLAMRSTLTVPLRRVTGARARPSESNFDEAIAESWRGVGTYVYRKVAAGTMQVEDGRAFYDVHDPARTIAIDLQGDALQRIVVEIDDETPEDAVHRIELACATGHGP